jgi:hypothetical protein
MKTSALREFLSALGGSLAAVGVPPKSMADLRSVAQLLEPFQDLDLEQLADFLRRAGQSRASGEVPAVAVPALDEASRVARELGEKVHALRQAETAEAGRLEEEIAQSRGQLQSSLGRLAGGFGLTAKFKEDSKWLPNITKEAAAQREAEKFRAEAAKTAARFRELLSQIQSADSYQAEAIRPHIDDLAAMKPDVLKAAAIDLGASDITAGKKFDGNKYVVGVLAKLTGIEPKTAKATRASKPPKEEGPPAPREQVDAMVRSLKEMIDRTRDPNAVSDAEIDAILERVAREFPESQQKEIAKEVTGKGGRNSKGAIDNLRADLTAVKRALESQKV